jgi:hypothetical protein
MTSRDVSDAIKIAERIIRVQGNVFIKDLLRKKKRTEGRIRIGTTKDEILDNLIEAIRSGYIVGSDLDAWAQEVEGWGKQHVYLYRVSKKLAEEAYWRSNEALQRRLKQHTDLELTDSGLSALEFPQELKISAVTLTDGVFEVIWRRRFEQWDRDESKDEKRTIDGDRYELRAFRQKLSRAVTRFVLKPAERVAALFVQIPLGDPTHASAREAVKDTLTGLLGWENLRALSLSDAIKLIDQEEMRSAQAGNDSQIVAQNTKFAAEGASVLFAADPGNTRWKSIEAVRRVRGALREKDFSGDSATFQIQLRGEQGMSRDVLMSLHAKQKRVYLSAQMTSKEVWYALAAIFGRGE